MNAQVTNSLEIQANMDPWMLRTTLNAVNAPAKIPADHITIDDEFTYKRDVEYHGTISTCKYTIFHNNQFQCAFMSMQYPACCGISILHAFHSIEPVHADLDKILMRFFALTSSQWKPNIQFVAVKPAIVEEEYDEDDDEYYDRVIGIEENYDYHNFIIALQKALKPTLISSFINKNSNNQCDLFQAVKPL